MWHLSEHGQHLPNLVLDDQGKAGNFLQYIIVRCSEDIGGWS